MIPEWRPSPKEIFQGVLVAVLGAAALGLINQVFDVISLPLVGAIRSSLAIAILMAFCATVVTAVAVRTIRRYKRPEVREALAWHRQIITNWSDYLVCNLFLVSYGGMTDATPYVSFDIAIKSYLPEEIRIIAIDGRGKANGMTTPELHWRADRSGYSKQAGEIRIGARLDINGTKIIDQIKARALDGGHVLWSIDADFTVLVFDRTQTCTKWLSFVGSPVIPQE